MTPHEMIARYAQAVARRLPKAMRADVQAELQELLTDSLRERAGGAAPTDAMATELLLSFGAPRDVALRYHTPPAIVEAADARLFGKIAAAVLVGLAIVTIGFALSAPRDTPDLANQTTRAYLQAALEVLGALTASFWTFGALRRHFPGMSNWKPRALPRVADPDHVNRLGVALCVLAGACGTLLLVHPVWFLDIFWQGRAAPAAVQALTYDPDFMRVRGPLLFSCLGLSLGAYAWVGIEGRWRAQTRRVSFALTLVLCALMAWCILAGPIFQTATADQFMRLALAIIGGFTLTTAWSERDRHTGGGSDSALRGAPSTQH